MKCFKLSKIAARIIAKDQGQDRMRQAGNLILFSKLYQLFVHTIRVGRTR